MFEFFGNTKDVTTASGAVIIPQNKTLSVSQSLGSMIFFKSCFENGSSSSVLAFGVKNLKILSKGLSANGSLNTSLPPGLRTL